MSVELKRDRFDRPLVIPLDGGKPKAMTRVSTLAKTLDDTYNLSRWQRRAAAVGVAMDPSINQRVAAVINEFRQPLSEGKGPLNELVDLAHERAGGNRGSSLGTLVHSITEALDNGDTPAVIPDEVEGAVTAYQWGTAHLEMVEAEVFVVVDEVGAAGTLDRLVRLPDGRVVVADLKTGKDEPRYPAGVITQVAIYARGQRYNPETGERTPLHPDLDPTTGLLIHAPIDAVDGKQLCDLYLLPLEDGWRKAHLSLQVRAERNNTPKLKKWSAA
jgi:hypothetical protein